MSVRHSFRLAIFSEAEWLCHYCGDQIFYRLPMGHPQRATVDHKHPLSKGGTSARDNLVACCQGCNEDKADIPYLFYWWFRDMRAAGHGAELLLAMILDVEPKYTAPVTPTRAKSRKSDVDAPKIGWSKDFDEWTRSSVAERRTFNATADGSIPSASTKYTLRDLRKDRARREILVRVGSWIAVINGHHLNAIPYRGQLLNPVLDRAP